MIKLAYFPLLSNLVASLDIRAFYFGLTSSISMQPNDDLSIGWEPYEDEIVSRYVNQNRTLEDTMMYMKDSYGFTAR